jgi:hypothetical protein
LFGAEFLLAKPTGFEQPVPPETRLEGMYVLNGAIAWKPDGAPPRLAPHGGVYLSLVSDQMPVDFGPPVGSIPAWLDPQRRKAGATLRRWAAQFEQEFEATQPIDSSMLALIRDSRSKISELAVRCLALTDNPTAVVQALAQAQHEDARKAAADGLREWLGVSVKRGEQLQEALAKYYERDDDIKAIYRLLWGISQAEGKDLATSLRVVEWLRNDKVEIRELAFDNLVRLTGRNFGYRPLSVGPQREPAVKRWFEYVNREGGLVESESDQ